MMTGVSRIAWRLGSSVASRSATQAGCGVISTAIAAPLPGAGGGNQGNNRVQAWVQAWPQCTGGRRTCKLKSDSDLAHTTKSGRLTRYIVQEYRDVTSNKRQRWAASSAGRGSVLLSDPGHGAFVDADPGVGGGSGSAPAT